MHADYFLIYVCFPLERGLLNNVISVFLINISRKIKNVIKILMLPYLNKIEIVP